MLRQQSDITSHGGDKDPVMISVPSKGSVDYHATRNERRIGSGKAGGSDEL